MRAGSDASTMEVDLVSFGAPRFLQVSAFAVNYQANYQTQETVKESRFLIGYCEAPSLFVSRCALVACGVGDVANISYLVDRDGVCRFAG